MRSIFDNIEPIIVDLVTSFGSKAGILGVCMEQAAGAEVDPNLGKDIRAELVSRLVLTIKVRILISNRRSTSSSVEVAAIYTVYSKDRCCCMYHNRCRGEETENLQPWKP